MELINTPGMCGQIVSVLGKFQLSNFLHYKVPMLAMAVIAAYLLIAGLAALAKRRKSGALLAVCDAWRGLLLAVCVLLAALAAWNYLGLCSPRYGRYLNAYEFYHYYLGSKYAAEIGYTDLYNASLIADEETGLKYSNTAKSIRDLSTGRYKPVDLVLAEKAQVKGRFSELRWQEWLKDIRWFKKELTTGRWNGILRDKGYNAPPVRSMLVGGLLTNQISTDSERGMQFLSILDLVLIGTGFLCVCWAFGPRAGLLMLALLGSHYMMHFSHMKGALLRTDFAMSLVIAVCMLKLERYKTAGALVAYSVMARVFPAVFLFGLGAKAFWELARVARVAWDASKGRWRGAGQRVWALAAFLLPHLIVSAAVSIWISPKVVAHLPLLSAAPLRTFLPVGIFAICAIVLPLFSTGIWGLRKRLFNVRYVQFFAAFAITVAMLVGASIAYSGGLDLWQDFGSKIGRHNQDISPWRVGFKYVFMGRLDKDVRLSATVKQIAGLEPVLQTSRVKLSNTQPATQEILPFKLRLRAALAKMTAHIESGRYREGPRLWWTIQALVLLFCLFAVKGLKDHQALAFSFVPTFFLVAPTYYYYIMLLVPFLFFAEQLERPSRALGLLMMFFTAMAGYYFYNMWQQKFPTYFYLSWMNLILVFYMMLLALLETAWFVPRAMRFRRLAVAAPAPAQAAESVEVAVEESPSAPAADRPELEELDAAQEEISAEEE